MLSSRLKYMLVMKMDRSYSELIKLPTLEERYRYLRNAHFVGDQTLHGYRPIYLKFLKSPQWIALRDEIILRDKGCDMGLPDYPISGRVIIHHINSVKIEDLIHMNPDVLLNPENLISVSHTTHLAIDYGDESFLPKAPIIRLPNDTCPWR